MSRRRHNQNPAFFYSDANELSYAKHEECKKLQFSVLLPKVILILSFVFFSRLIFKQQLKLKGISGFQKSKEKEKKSQNSI